MVAATVLDQIDFHQPGLEVVTLTVSDGETYTSKKFKVIRGALAMGNTDSDAALNVTFSGAVATVNWASISDKPLTLLLFGNPGN